jgi:GDP/UDP-N,N'-diacetylbacillosamine 2-epimerase (hydrolysing)
MRKICVVTGARSEYGLLRWLMHAIENSQILELQLIVTGMHLSPEFGMTYRDIEGDGFFIDKKIEMLLSSDTSVGVTKSVGLAVCGFADALAELKPDILLVLGDRFEIFAAVEAALIGRIPVAHIHGGETTEGAFDEAIRHSITKMSHLHFVAAEEYRRRVIQLGEDPKRVYCVGGLGIDNIRRLDLLDRDELEDALGFRLGPRNLLVTFHPVTLENGLATRCMSELLAALDLLTDTHIIFTMPNADTESRAIAGMVDDYVANHAVTCKAFKSLGQIRYLSCIRHVDGVVGNSSSGLLEAPSFYTGTVNIGDRQRGRLKASSVIDCEPVKTDIQNAIQRLYSSQFQDTLANVINPYGEGGASEKIVRILEQQSIENLLMKHFYDLS